MVNENTIETLTEIVNQICEKNKSELRVDKETVRMVVRGIIKLKRAIDILDGFANDLETNPMQERFPIVGGE